MIGWLRHNRRQADHRAETPLEPALFAALDPEELSELERELEGLGALRVPAAARERGWALVRREMDAQEARGAFRARVKTRPRSGRRGVAAAAFAAVALVLGGLGVHGLTNVRVAEGTSVTTMAAAAGSSGTTTAPWQPGTSGTAGASSSSKVTLPTTGDSGSVTGGSATSGPTGVPSQSTQQPSTTATATSATTAPPPTGRTTLTTQQSTSTSRQIMTKEQRQNTAVGVVSYVAQAVIAGNSVDAASQIAPGASAGLTHLMASLENPSGYSVQPLGEIVGEDVRVVLAIEDMRSDGQGGFVPVVARFVLDVRVGAEAALVTAIYSAP